MDLPAKINRYVRKFEGYLAAVDSLEVQEGDFRFKKILCLSHIEAMAAGRFPKKKPKDRFVKLVSRYGAWPDATRVSTPHLVAALERTEDPGLNALRAEFYQKYRRWVSGGHKPAGSRDPDFSELMRSWPQPTQGRVRLVDGRVLLRNLRLVELLYDYRNTLVHEAREPTLSFEDGDDSAPFYGSISTPDQQQEWDLVYPYAFLMELARRCLATLNTEFVTYGRDPYAGYLFGNLLRPELNDVQKFPVIFPCGDVGDQS